jgi:Protein of unknown function (DUF3775)
MSELRISTETVCFVIAKALAFDAPEEGEGLSEASNPSDENYQSVLEEQPEDATDEAGDATEEELRGTLEALNGDELADLIGLIWLGRDDRPIEDWPDILQEVSEQRLDNPIAEILGTPLLGEYLDLGIAKFGYSCTEIRDGHGPPPH